jgi:hypothetical protein
MVCFTSANVANEFFSSESFPDVQNISIYIFPTYGSSFPFDELLSE